MNLADKLVYAKIGMCDPNYGADGYMDYPQEGITYKEALVLALAGNSAMIVANQSKGKELNTIKVMVDPDATANNILLQVDAIIKELEK